MSYWRLGQTIRYTTLSDRKAIILKIFFLSKLIHVSNQEDFLFIYGIGKLILKFIWKDMQEQTGIAGEKVVFFFFLMSSMKELVLSDITPLLIQTIPSTR